MRSILSRVSAHSAPARGRRGKVGYQWAVYHRYSGHGSAGILATGITDDPVRARTVTESVMDNADEAAWGLLIRVVLDVNSAYRAEHPDSDWPPAGEIQCCRRAASGGFTWKPLFPRDNVDS